ncbi:MAG: site-specific integrase [bacterium]|nr:site-specific integrase [bacterium]
MKIEKRPSGSYRVRKMYQGKVYTVSFDFKPTQKEAMLAMAEALQKVQKKQSSMTFRSAGEEYINSKRNVLSPSTIRLYKTTIHNLSDKFCSLSLPDITAPDIQTEINRIAKEHSPKTVRNYHGFISSVLGVYRPEMKICTTLPQKERKEPYIPSDDDVRRILNCSKGTEYEIPLILACYGLRRSEICALTASDLEGDVLHISKAKVFAGGGEWVEKGTKTTSSTRDIIIPAQTADLIRKRGYIYKGHPNSISEYLGRIEDRLGIPRFTMHKLRHYFASKMSALNVPDADIMKMGGWETDHVMKTVYRHAMMDRDEAAKREAAEKLQGVLFS